MKNIIAAIAIVLGLGVTANAAKFDIKNLEVGMSIVDSIPVGDAGDYYDSSLGLDIHADYQLQENLAVGIETGFFSYSGSKDFVYGGVNYGSLGDASMSYYGVYGKYMLKPMDFGSKKANVYGIVGLAPYSVVDFSESTATGYGDIIKLGLSLGAGASMEVMPQWNVGLQLRYHMVSDFSTFAPMLTVGYHF
ncbi:MAG TPA: hypothetical protein DCZ92_10125 [Elusimicrobia bacterium]|nr:MAG: hypothetical protein A2016_12535 [Elusimicrobia bacterium GWF2_62_30]HBA61156.1 hypothetical protein [Elusimicrobiota bacterium]